MKHIFLSIAGGVGFVILAEVLTLVIVAFAVSVDSEAVFRAAQDFNAFVLGWSLWIIGLAFDVYSPADSKPSLPAVLVSLLINAAAYSSLVYVVLWRRAKQSRLP